MADLWLVLTLLAISACLATTGLAIVGLAHDSRCLLHLLTRLDWLVSGHPGLAWKRS
jgi:hypothetical protein